MENPSSGLRLSEAVKIMRSHAKVAGDCLHCSQSSQRWPLSELCGLGDKRLPELWWGICPEGRLDDSTVGVLNLRGKLCRLSRRADLRSVRFPLSHFTVKSCEYLMRSSWENIYEVYTMFTTSANHTSVGPQNVQSAIPQFNFGYRLHSL